MKKGRPYKSLYLPAIIIVAAVFTLLVVITVSTYKNISRDRSRAEESLLREGLVVIRAVEATLRMDLPDIPDRSRMQKIVDEVSREPSIAGILVFDAKGNVLASAPAKRETERLGDISSLEILLKEKGVVTRYVPATGEGQVYEVIKPFRPFSYRDPLTIERPAPGEERLREWSKDKIITARLRLGTLETAREQDIHHAFLMGGILVILGAGALYFIFIVQNYYLVDRSLARMRTYTENVLESMTDALISIDSQNNIVTLNRRAAEILGREERELRGKNIADVLGKDAQQIIIREGTRAAIRDREIEVNHRPGEGIPLSLSAATLKDEKGRGMGFVLLLRDMREIRELQEKVRRSERLASLGRLAAGMAHEIRNPLSSIRGFAQFFMQRFKAEEKEKEYASVMVKEVDRLNRVIAELLDFAKPRKPNREPHCLEEILNYSLKLLEPELNRKQIKVERILEPGLGPARVDRDQLSQAFLNLLLNSLESMGEGGKLRVVLEKKIENGEEAQRISITDSGRGIPQEDLGKVFEPFFSTKRGGTGLGLAIVHQIIEQHQGEISVESREGQGTTFHITLPLKD